MARPEKIILDSIGDYGIMKLSTTKGADPASERQRIDANGDFLFERYGSSCLDTARTRALPLVRRHSSGLFLCPKFNV
jgi:hypothetical protein